ncbi:MAG: phosphoribosylglycinamide formyltransferase [Gemmatimonadaceae bacterium]|nr:phosphoribosylglycinamide formyltransferase [Gemmatimonadaceae bacterium]
MTTSSSASARARIGVLASGSGSNLQALIDYFAGPGSDAGTIVWVGSNRADAGALARAAAAGIPHGVIANPDDAESQLAQFRAADVDLLVLAGYLKLVPPGVVAAYHGRLLNIHPSLLPAFGGAGMHGMRVHEAVLAHGVKVSGATVHFVDNEFDRGAIAAQWPVRVHVNDTPATLAARVLRAEHKLLPRTVAAVARGVIRLGREGGT